jgi:hypothetical protein
MISFILKLTHHSVYKIDDLFICNACDAEGVPDVVRSSGRHTEDHHLIRCLVPENAEDKALPTEQRLTFTAETSYFPVVNLRAKCHIMTC